MFARRSAKTLMPEKPVGRQALQLLLYSTHLALGYFMMLVIMAYQTQLFILIVFGLSLGHLVFNTKAPVAEKRTRVVRISETRARVTRVTSTGLTAAAPIHCLWSYPRQRWCSASRA